MSDKLANKLRKAADEYLKMYREDEANLLLIEKLLRSKKYLEAFNVAEDLDSIVSDDAIPVKVWDKMCEAHDKAWKEKLTKKKKKNGKTIK